jgi:hypothetical protein
MKLALLQPVLVPNLHDLAVLIQADKVVLQNTERWSRKGRVHRAMIRTPDGTQYINVPVRTEDRKKRICDVRIDQEQEWITPILRALKFNYRNSLYFDFYEAEIHADMEEGYNFDYLMQFALHLRSRLYRYLELDLAEKETLSSELDCYRSDPDELANLMSADTLFQEHDSRHYQRQARMRSEPDFKHPVYRQHFEGFEPYCCLYDLLFQFGPECFRIIEELS